MNTRRLKKLCEFLRTIPESKFNYNCFISHAVDGGYDEGELADMGCGTNGCALGWCTVLWPNYWVNMSDMPVLRTIKSDYCSSARISAMDFFDLTTEQAAAMFWTSAEEEVDFTGSQVADKIERLMLCYTS